MKNIFLRKLLDKKHIRMSVSEFCKLQRNELTLEDIYYRNKLDAFANKVMKSQYKAFIVFMIATSLLILPSITTYAVDTSKINNLGSTVLTLIRSCGYWFCIILATKDIVGALMEGSSKQIGSIIVKYITAFGAFYALPWIFDLIADLLA